MNRKNVWTVIGGIALIGLGILYLLGQFLHFSLSEYLWPLWIIGGGAIFFLFMFAGGPGASGLAIPGSILTMIGLILLVFNTFGHWEGWAYAWTLILASVGIGVWIHGKWSHNLKAARDGRSMVRLSAILFLAFGFFFEFVVGFSGRSGMVRIVGPLLLIVLGVYLLFRNFLPRKALEPSAPAPAATVETGTAAVVSAAPETAAEAPAPQPAVPPVAPAVPPVAPAVPPVAPAVPPGAPAAPAEPPSAPVEPPAAG